MCGSHVTHTHTPPPSNKWFSPFSPVLMVSICQTLEPCLNEILQATEKEEEEKFEPKSKNIRRFSKCRYLKQFAKCRKIKLNIYNGSEALRLRYARLTKNGIYSINVNVDNVAISLPWFLWVCARFYFLEPQNWQWEKTRTFDIPYFDVIACLSFFYLLICVGFK